MYVCNATIRESAMPEGKYTTISCSPGYAGFYVSGTSANVYMNNCYVYGKSKAFVIKGKKNTVYMSNSTCEGGKIRIDLSTDHLYIGKGCNFTEEFTTNPSYVTMTETVYTPGIINQSE